MIIKSFPPVESADKYGLLAIGGDCEPETLIIAYQSGIFPWEGNPPLWFAPQKRALLFLDDFHISRSLQKVIKRNQYQIKFNTDFENIILNCANSRNRRGAQGSWLTPDMISGYTGLFYSGAAYCVGAYQDSKLVGGLYGVKLGGMLTAESMFYTATDASKVALYSLVEFLKSQKTIRWIDCQAVNPFTKTLGVKEILRHDFMELLEEALVGPEINFNL